MAERDITVSVVSHGQNALVNMLLQDLRLHCARHVSVVVTQNVADPVPLMTDVPSYPLAVRTNPRPKGFGANHNAAFARCTTPLFCVVNPDIRLRSDPFPPLVETLRNGAAVVGPLVRDLNGATQDSARAFPTLNTLALKIFQTNTGPDYPTDRGVIEVDWIAGMFMLFTARAYEAVGGFDEAYFLYYEDVDLCSRLKRARLPVRYDPRAEVVHDARRASHRNPRLALHHLAGIIRFLSRAKRSADRYT